MKWYNIDHIKLGIMNIPTALRTPVLIAYIMACLRPLIRVYDTWKKVRASNIYKIEHTGQVCYLRGALNDALDNELRRIYIGDGNRFRRRYIYTPIENKTRYLGKFSLYQSEDYADTGVDFIVFAPLEIINTQINQLTALIEFYKLAGKRYKIVSI